MFETCVFTYCDKPVREGYALCGVHLNGERARNGWTDEEEEEEE